MLVNTACSIRYYLLCFISVSLLLLPINVTASSDIGFRIKEGHFSLSVRFGFAQLEEVNKNIASEITRADKLFFQTLAWFYMNKSHLSGLKKEVTVFWNIPRSNFHISVYEDNSDIEDINYTRGKAATTLHHQLEKLFKLKKTESALPGLVPLLLVRSDRPFQSKSLYTDIYFGSIPSDMHSRKERSYVLLLWSLASHPTWRKEFEKNAATLQPINLSADAAYLMLEKLE